MQKVFSLFLAVLCAGVLVSSAVASSHDSLEVSIVKAPVAPDGTTAGAITDFVLTFADRNPAIDGIGIKNGGVVEVVLPDDFSNVGGTNTVVILQGWPQSPRVPFPYATNIAGNTVTLTLNDDWMPGAFGPGPKQVPSHSLRLSEPRSWDVPGLSDHTTGSSGERRADRRRVCAHHPEGQTQCECREFVQRAARAAAAVFQSSLSSGSQGRTCSPGRSLSMGQRFSTISRSRS